VPPKQLGEHALASLAGPVEDAAAVALGGGRMMLLGGLTAADTSRADICIVDAQRDRQVGLLPAAVHDTAAVRIGSAVYVSWSTAPAAVSAKPTRNAVRPRQWFLSPATSRRFGLGRAEGRRYLRRRTGVSTPAKRFCAGVGRRRLRRIA